ncbi:MAG TPA: histidine triad nucleotide-binding protein [Thermoanaerobaculaceae bacterium]|nr:histidine triad nucleotide-binding protein [Thermoanaerobaculaceae bacterium]
MDGCIFCRMAEGAPPARILFADEEVVAFHDIAPRAPVHVLVIPRHHIASLSSASEDDRQILGRLLLAAAEVARRTGIAETGYRVVTNSGAGAGQSVFHLHLHVLGGRRMEWPPG